MERFIYKLFSTKFMFVQVNVYLLRRIKKVVTGTGHKIQTNKLRNGQAKLTSKNKLQNLI